MNWSCCGIKFVLERDYLSHWLEIHSEGENKIILPVPEPEISRRDYFAGLAMQSYIMKGFLSREAASMAREAAYFLIKELGE